MNLPHQEPIRFANEVLSSSLNKISVSCKFPFSPTLAMACEAAAQSSAGFAQESSEPKIGFLVSLKEITLEKEMDLEANRTLVSETPDPLRIVAPKRQGKVKLEFIFPPGN